MQTFFSEENGQPISVEQSLANHADSNQFWFDVGEGMGVGLVYMKDHGLVFMHPGGMPGYESVFMYNPCKDMYVVLMYNQQPKEPFVFLHIAQAIAKTLDASLWTQAKVKWYQWMHELPPYCKRGS